MTKPKLKGYYIYSHWTSDGELFYIGVGKNRRAWDFNGRNKIWKEIKQKRGCIVCIILDGFLNKEDAYLEELRLQKLNKPLACIEYGGGLSTLVFENTRKLQSKARTGILNPMYGKNHSDKTKKLISDIHKGRKGRKLKDSEIIAISERSKKKIINCRGQIFNSLKEAFGKFNLKSHTSISQCLNGKQKTAGTYPDGNKVKWEYYNPQ